MGYAGKYSWPISLQDFFTFDLFDLLIVVPGVHCCIVLVEYSNDMKDVYKNIEKYNPGIKCKISIVFDDMIADLINNKKLNSVVTELFIRTES